MSTQPRKKILFLITKSNWGGAQRYVFDLATGLRADFDVAVAQGGDGRLVEMLGREGVRAIDIPGLQRDISLRKEIVATRSILDIIRKERPDILHVNSSKAGVLGAFAGRLAGVPRIIFTSHGWAFNENRGLTFKGFALLMHYATIMLSHTTVCVSHALYAQMARMPLTRQRMVVVNPGRDVGDLLSRKDARAEIIQKVASLAPHAEHPWIGTIAELHPTKRLDTAIESMSQLRKTYPNVRYVIIGGGELAESLRDDVRKQNLTEHVFFTGEIADAARMLSAFDLFVLPSRSEAFGYVLLEAGAATLPVVATNVGGIPDIVEHGVSGTLVPPGDARALADAMNTYLTDTEKARTHAENLRKKIQDFSVRRMVEKTSRLYMGQS